MGEARNRNEASDYERRVLKVMENIQQGRICTPGKCPHCREKAEDIVNALLAYDRDSTP
jgi:hypothetical protein